MRNGEILVYDFRPMGAKAHTTEKLFVIIHR
jgi:hypothetical protein